MDDHSPALHGKIGECFPQSNEGGDNTSSATGVISYQPFPQSNTDPKPTVESSSAREQPSPNDNIDREQPSLSNTDNTDTTLEESFDHNPIGEFVEAVILYNCAGRHISVATQELLQFVPDVLVRVKGRPLAILTGSVAESMPPEVCCDTDSMVYHPTWPIVTVEGLGRDQVTAEQDKFVAECIQEQPAFLHLRASKDSESCFDHLCREGFLSSKQFVAQFQTDTSELHGPAVTCCFWRLAPSLLLTDTVPCLFSPHWPPCTSEFFSRPRPHGWSRDQLLSDIQRDGCHVVGKSSPHATRPDREFRWSFSVAERSLFHSMDDPMSACMYLLKAIKKEHWKEETNPGICSYFLKMACFWTFERLENSSTVLSLASAALDWLIMCYSVCNLPHYFIPDQNLIGHLPVDLCHMVRDKLSCIKQDLPFQALSCIELDTKVQGLVDSLKTDNGGDYRTLCGCDKSQLLEATRSILPGSHLDSQKVLKCMRTQLTSISRAVQERVTNSVSETDLFSPCLPEMVVAPMLYKLQSLTPSYLATNMAVCVHIAIGDVYMHLAFQTKEHTGEIRKGLDALSSNEVEAESSLSEISRKTATFTGSSEGTIFNPRELAEHHFRLACVPLTSPDGSTDGGFVGKVNLAKFYFIANQWEELGQCIGDFESSLNNNIMGQFGKISAYCPELIQRFVTLSMLPTMAEGCLANTPDMAGYQSLPCTMLAASLIYHWAQTEGDKEMLKRLNTGHMWWMTVVLGDKVTWKKAVNCEWDIGYLRRLTTDFLGGVGLLDDTAEIDIPETLFTAAFTMGSAVSEEIALLSGEDQQVSDDNIGSLLGNIVSNLRNLRPPQSVGGRVDPAFNSAQFTSLWRTLVSQMRSIGENEVRESCSGNPCSYQECPLD